MYWDRVFFLYFGDFLFDFSLIEPSRFGFDGGVGRWTLSQTTLFNGSIPFEGDEWLLCPTNVVVENELGSGVVNGIGVCFLLNVDRRASGLVCRGRSRNGCCWTIVGKGCSWDSSVIVVGWGDWSVVVVGAFGRGEERKRARIDWCAAAGGGGGGDVTLENEHVRAGGRGGGNDGPVRGRFVFAQNSFADKIFVVPKNKWKMIYFRLNLIKLITVFWCIKSNCSHAFQFSMYFFKCRSFIRIPSPT